MSEHGSVTILAIAWVSLLVLVAAGMVGVGRLVAAQTQATVAADAAALAAAPLTFLEGGAAAEAALFAGANGSRLVRCSCRDDPSFAPRVVTVEVATEVELPVFGALVVRARAAAEFAPLDLLDG